MTVEKGASVRKAFGFTRRQWFFGWVEYHIRHLAFKVRRVESKAATGWAADVREAIHDALCDMSMSSGVIVTQDGDLGVVFFDEAEAYIVKIEPARLMVLPAEVCV